MHVLSSPHGHACPTIVFGAAHMPASLHCRFTRQSESCWHAAPAPASPWPTATHLLDVGSQVVFGTQSPLPLQFAPTSRATSHVPHALPESGGPPPSAPELHVPLAH